MKNIEYCVVDPLTGSDGELFIIPIIADNMVEAAKQVNSSDLGDFIISFTRDEIERFYRTIPDVLERASKL